MTSCRTAKSCRCPWQTASLKNWTPPSTRTGKRTATTGGWYDKTAFRIDFTLNGQPDNYEGRQDFGDGEGSLVQHIQNYHEYYAKDENWKNFVLHNKGPEAWEQDKAEREMVLTEFIPYLKQHCNLSAMEQTATAALREGQNISPEQAAYYNCCCGLCAGLPPAAQPRPV